MRELIVDSFAGESLERALGKRDVVEHSAAAVADLLRRFFERIDENGPTIVPELGPCSIWLGSRNKRPDGTLSYGTFCIRKGFRVLVHRLSWVIANRRPIPNGHHVCHQCDNPGCPRAEHLFTGTQDTNLLDMRAKGRAYFNTFPTGRDHPNAKIDEQRAAEVRRLRGDGLSYAKIGIVVGLHASTVHDIVSGKTWVVA